MPYGQYPYGNGGYKGQDQLVLFLNSILSDETFGDITVTTGNVNVAPDSILSGEAWGSVTIYDPVDLFIIVPGIVSGEAWGTHNVINATVGLSALPPAQLPQEGDIRFVLDSLLGFGDVIPADRDVERDAGLETAITLTLGSDKRVDDTENKFPDDDNYHGGWCLDILSEFPGDQIGWMGWLLRRSKATNSVVADCHEYLLDGFQWMLDDGIISEFFAIVTRENYKGFSDILKMQLKFVRPKGDNISYTYYYNWQKQILKRG